MQIMIRATFKRAEKPGGRAVLERGEYAEVPDALVFGTMAQCAQDKAASCGDHEGAGIIADAIERAERDGILMTMND